MAGHQKHQNTIAARCSFRRGISRHRLCSSFVRHCCEAVDIRTLAGFKQNHTRVSRVFFESSVMRPGTYVGGNFLIASQPLLPLRVIRLKFSTVVPRVACASSKSKLAIQVYFSFNTVSWVLGSNFLRSHKACIYLSLSARRSEKESNIFWEVSLFRRLNEFKFTGLQHQLLFLGICYCPISRKKLLNGSLSISQTMYGGKVDAKVLIVQLQTLCVFTPFNPVWVTVIFSVDSEILQSEACRGDWYSYKRNKIDQTIERGACFFRSIRLEFLRDFAPTRI